MFRLLATLCLIATPALGAWARGLRVRYSDSLLGFGDSFLEQPESQTEAVAKGWVQTPPPQVPGVTGALANLTLWCPRYDQAYCIYTDDTGYVAGQQLGLDVSSIYNINRTDAEWANHGFTKWTAGQNRTFWTVQTFFVSPEFLTIPAATRIARRNTYVLLQDLNIFVSGRNGTLAKISTRINEFTNPASGFTRQNCVARKGRIYTHKITRNADCNDAETLPWALLTYDNQLIGVCLYLPGRHVEYPVTDERTNYFEQKTVTELRNAVNNGPQCLFNMPTNPGMIALHTYFIRDPLLMTCLFN